MKVIDVIVSFEFTDAHISVVDDGSTIDEFENKCIQLCKIFDFEYEQHYKRIDCTPHWVFDIKFQKSILTYQHYMNVLQAFAQEYQILIAAAREKEYEYEIGF
ncbi:MAG: hypothetical protein LBN29_01205 [Mediterranea sp.]|jgi:hypothetical protein|nr:hypothetical protein [Mediterranea sp.]